jgi:hypothetical protein
LIPEDEEDQEMEDDDKEENKDDDDSDLREQSPSLSSVYMANNSPRNGHVRFGSKGVKRNGEKRPKQTTRKSTGGKAPKRIMKEMSKNLGKNLILIY